MKNQSLLRTTFVSSSLLYLVLIFNVLGVRGDILTCSDNTDCCTKNWDLAKLEYQECLNFCNSQTEGCSIYTTKLNYMQFLAETNVRTLPDGRVIVVGYTERQRDCIRYFEKVHSDGWGKIKCCVDGTCTEFPDNYTNKIGGSHLRN